MENVAANAIAAATIKEAIGTAVSNSAAATINATASPSGAPKPSAEATADNDAEVNNSTSEAIEANTQRSYPDARVGKIVVNASSNGTRAFVAAPSGSTVTHKKQEQGQQQQQQQQREETDRLVYSEEPGDGLTVWLHGKREDACIEVVERSHPHFEIKISVKIPASRRTSVRKLGEVDHAPTTVEAKSIGEVDTITASLSLRKPDIQEALERWIRLSSQETGMALLPATMDRKIDLAAGKALSKWVSIGHAPRCVYLKRWLQDRLELVRTSSTTRGSGSADEGDVGRCAGGYRLRLLEAEKHSDGPIACVEVGTGVGEQKDGLKREKRDIAKPPDSGGETRDGDAERRWWWWEEEKEEESLRRELGLTSGTSASVVSASATMPPIQAKPSLGESITRDDPRDNVVGGTTPKVQVLERPFMIRGPVPSRRLRRRPLDDSSPGSGEGTRDPSLSHHHSPSSPQQQQRIQSGSIGDNIYSALSKSGAKSGKVSSTRSAGAVDDVIDNEDANGVPPHRYGLFTLDRNYAATTPSVLLNGRGVNAANGFDRESGCQKSRRQKRVSSVGSKHGFGSNEGLSTERGPQGSRWEVLTGRRCMTATGNWERQRTSDLGGGREREATNRGDDRRKRKICLKSYERELTEAEVRRRRAEANANAAERVVARRTAGIGGAGHSKERMMAREATQRVRDLTLLVERVRQEEQKKRVAAARASEQAVRFKQPFRERRGRSQKGACIGPRLPQLKHGSESSRDPQIEMTRKDKFYWDEHGRRYSRGGCARASTALGELDVALEAVRRVASASLEQGTDFRQPFLEMDADGDGRLSLAELGAALRRAGARLGLSQVTALFRHFIPNGLDSVARRDILWDFIDKRRLLDQWRKAGNSVLTAWSGSTSSRDQIPAEIRGIRDKRALVTRPEFSRTLEDSGVRVKGWEKEALLDRFEDGRLSGKVDWRDFVSVMQAADLDESRAAEDAITSSFHQHRNSQLSSSSSHWSNDINGHIDMTVGSLMGVLGPSDRRNKPPRDNQDKSGNQRRDDDCAPRTLGVNYTWQPLGSGVPSATFGSEGLPPNTLTARDVVNARRRGRINSVSSAPLAEPSGGSRKGVPFKEAFMKGEGTGVRMKVPLGVDSAAEALRVLDDLLGDQRELEAFLEEEIEKRLTFKKEERVALDREGL